MPPGEAVTDPVPLPALMTSTPTGLTGLNVIDKLVVVFVGRSIAPFVTPSQGGMVHPLTVIPGSGKTLQYTRNVAPLNQLYLYVQAPGATAVWTPHASWHLMRSSARPELGVV
jgi:hypothetical protein